MENIIWFENCNYKNKQLVGGKNASLGELLTLSKKYNIRVADGFAITTKMYDSFLKDNNLDIYILNKISNLNFNNINEVKKTSLDIKQKIINSDWSIRLEKEILDSFNKLKLNYKNLSVAVRSSAIDEDSEDSSFAGQQDTFLNVSNEKQLLETIKHCFASLFNTHALTYRHHKHINVKEIKISVGIQKMVRSDIGSAGVAFSLETESGNDKVITINGGFGLGELVVGGEIKPDEFLVDKRILELKGDAIVEKILGNKNIKMVYNNSSDLLVNKIETSEKERNMFCLNDEDIHKLGNYIFLLEKEYRKIFNKDIAIDIEWALDGIDKKIYIVQVRPETIHSNKSNKLIIERYYLKENSEVLLEGVSIGNKISSGKVKLIDNIDSKEIKYFKKGDILVTKMTTPDWEPIMKIAGGIITDKGGRTCHAAIVAREIGVVCIVGTGNATSILKNEDLVTINCSENEKGSILKGLLKYEKKNIIIKKQDNLPIQLMLNIGSPENVYSHSLLPQSGVGLTRIEFIMNSIKIHPLSAVHYPNIPIQLKREVEKITRNQDPKEYFVNRLSKGIGKIASAFYPHKIIVRLSDFKSNEYCNLIGGKLYEPNEENPMIGWRGASRYYSPEYKKAFKLECLAIKYVIENMKLDNVIVMIPFCRTTEECRLVLKTMKEFGLERGAHNLEVYLMCEIPSNVIEADNFSKYIDGVSIGGNDLLQLTLGLDRDSDKLIKLSDYHNTSYLRMISRAIDIYKKNGIKVGFCGQQPSDDLEFAKFLLKEGINSISITPDSLLNIYNNLTIPSVL